MSHSALQLVTSRTLCDAKTQRGIWDDSSCCDRAVLLVLLRILNPEDTILLDSSVLCYSNLWWNNQTDSSDRSLWDYATWKQDEINHAGFILIDVVISVWFWFWFFFFTDKHSWNHDYVTFVGVCSKCFLTFVFVSSCSVTFFTFHPKNKSVCDFGTRSRSHPAILVIFLLIMQL